MVGGVAQLGERCVRNAEVVSSILILSTKNTNKNKHLAKTLGAFFLPVRKKYGITILPLMKILAKKKPALGGSCRCPEIRQRRLSLFVCRR